MSYNFFGFSPKLFEQFARTVGALVFGPGLTAFGNGPDGGREAVFRGKVPYPYPPTDCWNGYGILQAKCKEKIESTEKDQNWAINELKKELAKFGAKKKRRKPSPEYYIFITNVELSSTQDGAKDQANALLENYKSKFNLKGYSVWDANQLSVYIDNYDELRRRFSIYYTSGDFFHEFVKIKQQEREKPARLLTSFLERELRAEDAARLDQAGHRIDDTIRLATVFFDLPVSLEPTDEPPTETFNNNKRLPSGALRELLESASLKLDPRSIQESSESIRESIPACEQLYNCFVFIGGPGSGKSTLGQFLSQINRAALLDRRPAHQLEQQVRDAIADIKKACQRDDLPWPATPRYPFRVELNLFAKALASKGKEHIDTLSQFLIQRLSRDEQLTHQDLVDWLKFYPWLLVLDGLDEVPASSNRSQLMSAIDDFISEARQLEADLFIVATTRPQGYSDEFKLGSVTVRYVCPLSNLRSLEYARRYATARFGQDDIRRIDQLVSTLTESANNSLTAKLMSSPLQVTFMATVVAARGKPADNRWQLFSIYYRTIYERELQKAVPPYAELLGNHQATIDRLHHDVGFILQARGEVAGGTDASIPLIEFNKLAGDYLEKDGWSGSEKMRLLNILSEAADLRLVFLTSRSEGRLSFDIRSLQEYMAAECLMTGDRQNVVKRLNSIVCSSYWRNVLIFSVGRAFSDTQFRHFQDDFRLLFDDLNRSSDKIVAQTKLGSAIALEVLESGAVSQYPRIGRHLAKTALELLDLPAPDRRDVRTSEPIIALIESFRPEFNEEYKTACFLMIEQKRLSKSMTAWIVLTGLVVRDIEWANELFNKSWPSSYEEAFSILLGLRHWPRFGTIIMERLSTIMPRLHPRELWKFQRLNSRDMDQSAKTFKILCYLCNEAFGETCQLAIEGADKGDMQFSYQAVPAINKQGVMIDAVEQLCDMKDLLAAWVPFLKALKFLKDPCAEKLANVLEELAESGCSLEDCQWAARFLPWPLASCMQSASSISEFKTLGSLIRNQALGDVNEWRQAEIRWTEAGVSEKDFEVSSEPFSSKIAELGIPPYSSARITYKNYRVETSKNLFNLAKALGASKRAKNVLWLAVHAARMPPFINRAIDPVELRTLITKNGTSFLATDFQFDPKIVDSDLEEWLEFIDWYGLSPYLSMQIGGLDEIDGGSFKKIVVGLESNLDRRGLLRIVGMVAIGTPTRNVFGNKFIEPDRYSDPKDRAAAVFINFSKTSLIGSDLSKAADIMADVIEGHVYKDIRSILRNLLLIHTSIEVTEFWFLLWERLMKCNDGAAEVCYAALANILRRRPSGLMEQSTAISLDLPASQTASC